MPRVPQTAGFKATNNGDSTTMALVQRISQQIINAIKT